MGTFWLLCFLVQVFAAVTRAFMVGPGCTSNYCLNGATCNVDQSNYPTCYCKSGFVGMKCETQSTPDQFMSEIDKTFRPASRNTTKEIVEEIKEVAECTVKCGQYWVEKAANWLGLSSGPYPVRDCDCDSFPFRSKPHTPQNYTMYYYY